MTEAAHLAGFRDVTTIDDAVAAAQAYGFIDRPGTTVAVYHLGGGTFEVSLLSIGAVATEVVDTAGDAFLGGEAIDDSIMQWFTSRCRVQHGVELVGNRLALQSLRPAVQLAKRRLSDQDEAEIQLPFVAEDGQKHDLHFTLARAELQRITLPFLKRTLEITSAMFQRAGVSVEGIDAVLLVGGQTRMPLVQHEVGRFFGRAPSLAPAPEEVIALGACMGAATGGGGDDELELAYY
jgi:molecular chaperone DnaK